jgi:hypothetical protein
MSKTIELPIPSAETREEIRKLAHQLAMDSIVMQTLERYLIQVLTEVHESRIKPLRKALLDADEHLTGIENYGGEPAVRARRARADIASVFTEQDKS